MTRILAHDETILSEERPRPDTICAVAASCEARATAVVDRLDVSYHASYGLLYYNEDMGSRSREAVGAMELQRSRLKQMLMRRCDRVLEMAGGINDPRKQVLEIREALKLALAAKRDSNCMVVDVTTFTREALVVFLSMARGLCDGIAARLYYATPRDYGLWLSRGFGGVRNIMGFAGFQYATRPTLLVVLSGFESERTTNLIGEYEPSLVLLGLGEDKGPTHLGARNLLEQQLALARQDTETFGFPLYSASGCAMRLEEVVQKYHATHNIVLAPMSTKLSTVGTLLFAERHPAVQLVYCVPGEYNASGYSTGIGDIYVDELQPKHARSSADSCTTCD